MYIACCLLPDRAGWGHIRILYKAPTDYTKPRQTLQSPKKTIQRHRILDKNQKYYTKTYNIRQKPKTIRQLLKISNKSSNTY